MAIDFDLDDELEDTEAPISEMDEGSEYEEANYEEIDFEALGIDPAAPTLAKPGSEQKVLTLAARYAAGVPLWHEKDCYDHGPAGDIFRSLAQQKN